MSADRSAFVALKWPPGYEDLHADLVVEDAMNRDWPWDPSRDEGAAVVVSIDRLEGYERTSLADVAKEAIRNTWPGWSVLRRGDR